MNEMQYIKQWLLKDNLFNILVLNIYNIKHRHDSFFQFKQRNVQFNNPKRARNSNVACIKLRFVRDASAREEQNWKCLYSNRKRSIRSENPVDVIYIPRK